MASSNPDNYWVTTALMLKVIQLLYLLFNPGLVLVVWTAIPYQSIPVGVWIWKTTKDRNHVASLLVRPSGWKWKEVHPRKLSWNLRIYPWNRKIIFQTILFRFYVDLRGCMGKTKKDTLDTVYRTSITGMPLPSTSQDIGRYPPAVPGSSEMDLGKTAKWSTSQSTCRN